MVTVYHSQLLGVRTPDSSGALWGAAIASWSDVFLAYILFRSRESFSDACEELSLAVVCVCSVYLDILLSQTLHKAPLVIETENIVSYASSCVSMSVVFTRYEPGLVNNVTL